MDKYHFYQLNERGFYYTGQYRCNGIGKWASVGTHDDPKGKDSVLCNAMWLLGELRVFSYN